MQAILALGLDLSGVCFLAFALVRACRIIRQLPSGQARRQWFVLIGLIILFVVGYLSHATMLRSDAISSRHLVVPVIFFLGAAFVWLIVSLSLQTVSDIRRVTLLEHENITDALIGIYNRRYLDRRLPEEFARARRYTVPLSVLLVDIDLFKRVNDTYGHQVGDQVLSYLGKLLLQIVREPDIVARYGGEEILIIAPNTPLALASTFAERVRQHVETHELVLTKEFTERRTIQITVSIGVACLSQIDDSSIMLVRRADDALYRAKLEGRNCVAIHKASSMETKVLNQI